jgi:hypothetical protein
MFLLDGWADLSLVIQDEDTSLRLFFLRQNPVTSFFSVLFPDIISRMSDEVNRIILSSLSYLFQGGWLGLGSGRFFSHGEAFSQRALDFNVRAGCCIFSEGLFDIVFLTFERVCFCCPNLDE